MLFSGCCAVSVTPPVCVWKRSIIASNLSYLQSNVYRYHDTFPHPPEIPVWPELIPELTEEMIPFMQQSGTIVGDPDHAIEQCKRWEAAGADQLVFGLGTASKADSLEMVRLMGEHVIPKLDTDPVHRTTRLREAAAQKV